MIGWPPFSLRPVLQRARIARRGLAGVAPAPTPRSGSTRRRFIVTAMSPRFHEFLSPDPTVPSTASAPTPRRRRGHVRPLTAHATAIGALVVAVLLRWAFDPLDRQCTAAGDPLPARRRGRLGRWLSGPAVSRRDPRLTRLLTISSSSPAARFGPVDVQTVVEAVAHAFTCADHRDRRGNARRADSARARAANSMAGDARAASETPSSPPTTRVASRAVNAVAESSTERAGRRAARTARQGVPDRRRADAAAARESPRQGRCVASPSKGPHAMRS